MIKSFNAEVAQAYTEFIMARWKFVKVYGKQEGWGEDFWEWTVAQLLEATAYTSDVSPEALLKAWIEWEKQTKNKVRIANENS